MGYWIKDGLFLLVHRLNHNEYHPFKLRYRIDIIILWRCYEQIGHVYLLNETPTQPGVRHLQWVLNPNGLKKRVENWRYSDFPHSNKQEVGMEGFITNNEKTFQGTTKCGWGKNQIINQRSKSTARSHKCTARSL